MTKQKLVVIDLSDDEPVFAECATCEEKIDLTTLVTSAATHLHKNSGHTISIEIKSHHIMAMGADIQVFDASITETTADSPQGAAFIALWLNSYRGSDIWTDIISKLPLASEDTVARDEETGPVAFTLTGGHLFARNAGTGEWAYLGVSE